MKSQCVTIYHVKMQFYPITILYQLLRLEILLLWWHWLLKRIEEGFKFHWKFWMLYFPVNNWYWLHFNCLTSKQNKIINKKNDLFYIQDHLSTICNNLCWELKFIDLWPAYFFRSWRGGADICHRAVTASHQLLTLGKSRFSNRFRSLLLVWLYHQSQAKIMIIVYCNQAHHRGS